MLQYFKSILSLVVAYVNVDYKHTCHILWQSSKHEEIRLPPQIVFVFILYFIGTILSKKCQSEGLKKVKKKGDGEICHRKGGFLKKGRLNLHAMHLQEN